MPRALKVVLVGCGGISRAWLRPMQEERNVRVIGFVDISEAAARTRAEEYGDADAVAGADLKAVLKATHPDIVCNCTVPEAHMPVTLEALKHGCHVYCEKPMADSMAAARRMNAAAAKAGRLLDIMQNRRYERPIGAYARFVKGGRLGDLTTLECDFHIGAHFGGFRQKMQHVLLVDMSIHHFDMARAICGCDPVAVTCHEWNPKGSWYTHGAAAVCIFEMTNGLVFTYRGSWCTKGINTSWHGEWHAIGTRGGATWDGAEDIRAQVSVPSKNQLIWPHKDVPVRPISERSLPKVGHAGGLREFFKCVRSGAQPETAGADNIKSLAMVFGAVKSAETGRRVEIKT